MTRFNTHYWTVPMVNQYSEKGIRFQYPDNWTLNRDEARADCQSVTVSSDGTAFWTLAVHPRATDPEQLIEAVLTAMQEEYKELEDEQVCEEVGNHELSGRDLNFYCMDLTNTAWVRSLRTDRATYTIFCQAEDREFNEVKDVFRAMMASFLANVDQQIDWDSE
jgi:hypothetical protein